MKYLIRAIDPRMTISSILHYLPNSFIKQGCSLIKIIIYPQHKHDRPAAAVPAESQILVCKPSILFKPTNVTTNISLTQISGMT